MSTITLTLKEPVAVPLEAEVLTPDVLASLGHDEIRVLPVFLGKRQRHLGDFFEIVGEAGETLEIRGDVGRVKWIGRGMTRGRIFVNGNAGMHLGAFMKGGSIEVAGDASDWVGAEMTGGTIHVRGSAGGQVGAAYRGSLSGMKGGTIVVDGSAGMELGRRMKRGTIAVQGPVGIFAGLQMKGGTIVLLSGAEIRTGAWMVRGTIVSLAPLQLLPAFAYACAYNPPFLGLFARHLRTFGLTLPHHEREGAYHRYSGDASIPGKGEILLWAPRGAAVPDPA